MKHMMTDAKVTAPTCKRIVVKVERDEDMHPSDFDDDLYTPEDVEAFENDQWRFLGIYAVATVLVPLGGASFILTVPGPGLWGIDSKSTTEYLHEVAVEQINELKAVLDALHIDHADVEIDFGKVG